MPKDEDPLETEDAYNEDEVEEMLDEDELDDGEAGFLKGFEKDEDESYDKKKKKKSEP